MLPQNASLDFSLFLPGYSDVLGIVTLRYVRGAVTLGPIRGLPHTHTLNLFSAAAPQISQPETAGRGEAAGVCVCSGWIRARFRCVSLSRRPHAAARKQHQ